MSIPPPTSPTPSPTSRGVRARFGLLTLVVLVAATVSLVVVNVLGRQVSTRLDATATREHQLSPRSRALLGTLAGSYEVVIAAPLRDPRTVDRRALVRLVEVLDQFKRAPGLGPSTRIDTTLIDTGSTTGGAQFASLLERLRQRDSARIDKQVSDIGVAQQAAEALAAWLESASPRLIAARDAAGTEGASAAQVRAYLDRRAGECRASAAAMKETAAKAGQALKSDAGTGVPDIEQASSLLRGALGDLELGLNDIAVNLNRLNKDQGSAEGLRDLARGLAVEAARERDKCALARDVLERLPRLDIARIARAVRSTSAALIIGPPEVGLTAIDLGALLPSPGAINAAGSADLGRNAEELIATALASLAHPVKPIVVLVHGQPRGFAERTKAFEFIAQRLALRGIDMVVWEAAVNLEPPSTSRLNPTGKRPLVFVCFNADSPSGGAQGQTGPERATKLGKALNSIVESGRPLLLSMFPSTLPTYGEPDPTTTFLPQFGLRADSARPLLHEMVRSTGREVQAAQVVRSMDVDHPVARAIRGLATRLQWPIPMRIVDPLPAGVKVTKLFEVSGPGVWGESQWLRFLQVPIDQHPQVPDPPAADSERDDTKGPWVLAALAERPFGASTQRLVAVGSNTWLTTPIMGEMAEVDGRPFLANPGNAELFEAAVSWLAGQDELIAQSPTARAVPLIGPLSGSTRMALKLLAIVGMPGLVLLLGVAWRMMRG